MKGKVEVSYKSELHRLNRLFESQLKNMAAGNTCEMALSRLGEFEDRMWIVESLTKEGMSRKPAMMGECLQAVYGAEEPPNAKLVNLNDLVRHKVGDNKEFIQQTSERAERIWMLEKRVNEIIHETK